MENHVAIIFGDVINFYALVGFRSLTCGKVKLMGMERTDDFTRSTDAFRERTLAMWAAILSGKEASVSLPKDRDFFAIHNVAPALAHWDFFDTAQIDVL